MRVDIVVFDGVDELDALGPLEVLRRASEARPGVRARLVHLGAQRMVQGAGLLRFEVDAPLVAGDQDVLVVPGGGWAARAARGARAEALAGALPAALAEARPRVGLLASVCTGALLVAHAGLVEGRRVATHHAAREDLARFGAVVVADRVVDDGDLASCGGVTSGLDLALWIVERELDPVLADEIARRLEYRRARPVPRP